MSDLHLTNGVEPAINADGVPFCTADCRSFDGKRCEKTGFRPDRLCEPAVIEMAKLVRLVKG